MYDVSVYVFEPAGNRWRLLSLAEQEAVWARRVPPALPAGAYASGAGSTKKSGSSWLPGAAR
jgi:hypothetical protein